MADSVQIAAYEGGALRVYATGEKSREAVLALPLSRLIVKMLRVPADKRDDLVGYAKPILQSLSPFPDEQLTVSCETVRESESSTVVIAAALPEGATDDIAEALDGAKLTVTRVDALVLGQVRGLWGQIGAAAGVSQRRLVLFTGPDCLSVLVLDGDTPVAIRAVGLGGDLRREVMLSLLEAEDFGGARALTECVLVGEADESVLSAFGPVRKILCGDDDLALKGVAERAAEAQGLDALPDSWREMLVESRFKGKLVRAMAVAGAFWLLAMGVLFGVPMTYNYLAGRQRGLCRAQPHAKRYSEVKALRDKVELVRKYSDHSHGALEMLRTVVDALPEPVELDSFSFVHGGDRNGEESTDGVRLSAHSNNGTGPVYEFNDALAAMKDLFPTVTLRDPSTDKSGVVKFGIDCYFVKQEDANR